MSEQTAIISFCKINLPVFITEADRVYRAVGTGTLNVVQVNLSLWRVKLQLKYENFLIGPYSCIHIWIKWLCKKINLQSKIFIIVQDRSGERRDCDSTLLQYITNNNTLLVENRKWKGIITDIKQGRSSVRPHGYFRNSKTKGLLETSYIRMPQFCCWVKTVFIKKESPKIWTSS